ncbi:biotin--[acetyl-CoA-carboxylase] ligase [Candidatus Sumerlaeota bacterium]|nr:biotin--[acetyl-CoA-carboxylase] ligase [Candidatus Sumerlaeota bacterium]
MIAERMRTKRFGRAVSYFHRIDSTNTFALKVAGERDALHGRLIVAGGQSGGRGRHGRRWWNEPEKDILCSLILCPPEPRAMWHLLTLSCGASICEALRDSYGLPAGMRWPNDVLIDGRKLCGVLTESGEDRLVIGFGVNCNGDPEKLPEDARAATSLRAELGRSVQRWSLLSRILECFERRYALFCTHDTEGLRKQHLSLLGTLGRRVRVWTSGKHPIEGMAIDLEESGRLVVLCDHGPQVSLSSGEVTELKLEEKTKS